NETKSSLDICYKGQQAIARNLHEFETYGLGGVLDYYNISAKDCLNINRDVWKEKFNLKIKDDLLELLKIYLDNNKSPSISMIKNMLSKEVRKKINADLDELWLDYKFEFKNLNRRLKLGKL
nr:histidine kinase [Acinetobacter baumannii]